MPPGTGRLGASEDGRVNPQELHVEEKKSHRTKHDRFASCVYEKKLTRACAHTPHLTRAPRRPAGRAQGRMENAGRLRQGAFSTCPRPERDPSHFHQVLSSRKCLEPQNFNKSKTTIFFPTSYQQRQNTLRGLHDRPPRGMQGNLNFIMGHPWWSSGHESTLAMQVVWL